ncbi:SDR family NAD(P)-dependent oxidoreductase [Variovorax sp. LjRoot84]|uniref:SDR family oxidoreductase n=1 Tax=Variovorax sp. LjRoot84 TaxID=3342340 RepID=UPI003ECCECC0
MTLSNSTILITGGSSGIGLALARRLLQYGNRVIVCGRGAEALTRAQVIEPALITRICDVTNAGSRRELVDWIAAEHPDLSVVFNNAGVQSRRSFTGDHALDDLEQEVAINFTAPVQLIGELLPLLRRQQRAVIVNVTSGLAFAPMADVPVYCATKAALHSFTLSLRHQLRHTAVKVVEMVPPIVDTGLGGDTRSDGTKNAGMMSPDAFASEALALLDEDRDEVMVGLSINTRQRGESLFQRMNGG